MLSLEGAPFYIMEPLLRLVGKRGLLVMVWVTFINPILTLGLTPRVLIILKAWALTAPAMFISLIQEMVESNNLTEMAPSILGLGMPETQLPMRGEFLSRQLRLNHLTRWFVIRIVPPRFM